MPDPTLDPTDKNSAGHNFTPWDFLKHFVTFSMTGAAVMFAIFGYLGLDRLSQIQDSVEGRIELLAKGHVEASLHQRQSVLEGALNGFQQKTEGFMDRVQRELQPYEYLANKQLDPSVYSNIRTMAVVEARLTQLFLEDEAGIAIQIAQVAVRDNLPGTSHDFHNVAAELARNDQLPLAISVIDNGLALYSEDIDLLADGMKYSSMIADFKTAKMRYENLKAIPFAEWNWRCFDFCADYLLVQGKTMEAMELYETFRTTIPKDERAYSGPAAYWLGLGRFDKVVDLLDQALDQCARTAQSGLILAQAQIELGDYEAAVVAVDRALLSSADSQPSVNQSALLWTRANALDSWVHEAVLQRWKADPDWRLEPEADAQILRKARASVIDYNAALAMGDTIGIYLLRKPERVRIIEDLMKKAGADAGSIGYVLEHNQDKRSEMLEDLLRAIQQDASVESGPE